MIEVTEGIFIDEQSSVVSMHSDVFHNLMDKIPDKDSCLYKITHCGDSTRWADVVFHVIAKHPQEAYKKFAEHCGQHISKEDTITIAFESNSDNILR